MRPSLARPKFPIETLVSLLSTQLLVGYSMHIEESSIGDDSTLTEYQREPSAGMACMTLNFRYLKCVTYWLRHLSVTGYLGT